MHQRLPLNENALLMMRGGVLALAVCGAALAWSDTARAAPPVILSAGQRARHPVVVFSAPKSDHVVIEMGTKPDHRVCYLTQSRKRLCLRDTLAGYSWSSGASESLTVRTRFLATVTTFTWFVGTRAVGSKRIRAR